jgi:hypothetical protein
MSMRVVTVLAILLALVTAAALRWGVSRWQSQPTAPLELTITAAKHKVLLGEPVTIKLLVTNKSDKDVLGLFYLSFETETLHILIAPPGESEFTLYYPVSLQIAERKDKALRPIMLKAGETREAGEFVSYDVKRSDFALPIVGKYKLKAVHFFDSRDFNKKVESNVIEVEVVQPESKEDKEALQFIIDHQLQAYLTAEARLISPPEGKTVNDQVQLLQEFLKKFEGSTYAPYVRLGLEAICREQEFPACQK